MALEIIGRASGKLKGKPWKKPHRPRGCRRLRVDRPAHRGGSLGHVGHRGTLLRKMVRPLASAIRLACDGEKERRWFPALSVLAQVVCGLLFHLLGLTSMRSTVEKVNHSPELHIGKVSLSTFSDAMNSARRLKVLREVFQNLLLLFSNQAPRQLQKFRHLAAIDSTIIHCVLSAIWAEFRKAVNACKAHLVFDLERSLPQSVAISAARVHDRRYFEVFLKKGWTYIVDRAYNVYSLFDEMIDRGIFFVTRLKSNAQYAVVKRMRVKRKHRKLGVVSDEIIRLGAGAIAMMHELRLVTFQADGGKLFHFLTNRFDLAPTSVAALYRARWGIELFFKFLKRTLRASRPLARSEVGAEVHVFLALITDLLLKCLAKAVGRWEEVKRHVPVTFLRVVRDLLLRPWSPNCKLALAETLL